MSDTPGDCTSLASIPWEFSCGIPKMGRHTVSVIPEKHELIVPLRDDTKRILEESNDDEKSANCRNISIVLKTRKSAWFFSLGFDPYGGK